MSRTAEEWGRLAVSLPGWRWMPGARNVIPPRSDGGPGFASRILDAELTGPPPLTGLPDPDDPATAGCLLALLGDRLESIQMVESTGEPDYGWRVMWFSDRGRICSTPGSMSVGRACIAAAEALGRWPNSGRMVAE